MPLGPGVGRCSLHPPSSFHHGRPTPICRRSSTSREPHQDHRVDAGSKAEVHVEPKAEVVVEGWSRPPPPARRQIWCGRHLVGVESAASGPSLSHESDPADFPRHHSTGLERHDRHHGKPHHKNGDQNWQPAHMPPTRGLRPTTPTSRPRVRHTRGQSPRGPRHQKNTPTSSVRHLLGRSEDLSVFA